ncbi:MAG: flagellar export protein FliJ [Desulforhopalus sp.]
MQTAKPFTLDSVLNYRRQLERLAQQRLFAAESAYNQLKDTLAGEEHNYKFLLRESERLQANAVSIIVLMRYDERLNFLQQRIKAIRKTLAEKETNVLNEQKNLEKRRKDRRVMEHLKERQNRYWKNYLSKKEMTILDEIAVFRHNAPSR